MSGKSFSGGATKGGGGTGPAGGGGGQGGGVGAGAGGFGGGTSPMTKVSSGMRKDFAAHSTAAIARRESPLAKPGVSRAGSPGARQAIGGLFAYLLPDANSYPLHQALVRNGFEIDESTGVLLRVRAIDDPAKAGDKFNASLTAEMRARRKQEAEAYIRKYVTTNREAHHVIGESRRLAGHFGVGIESLPCIAFAWMPGGKLECIWRIKPAYYADERARTATCRSFLAWLRSQPVQAALRSIAEANGGDVLTKHLEGLSTMVERAIGDALVEADELRSRARAARPEIPDGVRLVFATGETVMLDGVDLELTQMPRTMFALLARSPGEWVSHEQLVRESRGLVGDLAPDNNKPIRDDKSAIMQAIRKAATASGLDADTIEALEGLISTKRGAYRLNLREDEILFR